MQFCVITVVIEIINAVRDKTLNLLL